MCSTIGPCNMTRGEARLEALEACEDEIIDAVVAKTGRAGISGTEEALAVLR